MFDFRPCRRVHTPAVLRCGSTSSEIGRTDLADDVVLIANELVANAVMHARTEMLLSVELAGDGVRVAVADGSHVLPHWAPSSPTAMSGRGLPLVVRLSRAWGVEPLPDGGKRVWAQVDSTAATDESAGFDDLVELWSDEPWPVEPATSTRIEIELDIDVQAMLDSRAHTEDLVRDLQLTLLSLGQAADAGNATRDDTALVALARQLDSANEQFHDARRQMFDQTVSAARRHEAHTTLHLRLQCADSARAHDWLDALDTADRLTAAGTLLLPPFPAAMTAFRRRYISAIIDQLSTVA